MGSPSWKFLFFFFGSALYHCWHFFFCVKSQDLYVTSLLWSLGTSPGGDSSLCLWIEDFSALNPCLRLPCSLLKGYQAAAANKNLDGFWFRVAPAQMCQFVDATKGWYSLLGTTKEIQVSKAHLKKWLHMSFSLNRQEWNRRAKCEVTSETGKTNNATCTLKQCERFISSAPSPIPHPPTTSFILILSGI